MSDSISRQAAIDAVYKCADIFAGDMPIMVVKADAYEALAQLPTAQPDGWFERNKDGILKAGMEGREVEFRIGGRLFAIREKAQ